MSRATDKRRQRRRNRRIVTLTPNISAKKPAAPPVEPPTLLARARRWGWLVGISASIAVAGLTSYGLTNQAIGRAEVLHAVQTERISKLERTVEALPAAVGDLRNLLGEIRGEVTVLRTVIAVFAKVAPALAPEKEDDDD